MKSEQCAALTRALDMLGATHGELARGSTRSDERRRHDLIAQRRLLAVQTAKVGELADALFEEIGDRELLSTYRRLFSAARSKAANHQATWSAIEVIDDNYRTSAREAGDAYRLFSTWMRCAIAENAN